MPRKTRRLTSSKKQQRTRSKSRAGVGLIAGLGGIAVVANLVFEAYKKRRIEVYKKIARRVIDNIGSSLQPELSLLILKEFKFAKPLIRARLTIQNTAIDSKNEHEQLRNDAIDTIRYVIENIYRTFDALEAEEDSKRSRYEYVAEVLFKKYDRYRNVKTPREFYREQQQDKLQQYFNSCKNTAKQSGKERRNACAIQAVTDFKTKESTIWKIPPIKLKFKADGDHLPQHFQNYPKFMTKLLLDD